MGLNKGITPGEARGISEDITPNSKGVQPKTGKSCCTPPAGSDG